MSDLRPYPGRNPTRYIALTGSGQLSGRSAARWPVRSNANSIDEYIAGFPPGTRTVLEELRALIRASAPDATETISYAIPTFVLNGHLVHFAGYEKHIGFYPTGAGIEAFKEELKPYKAGKGSVQFPLGQPMPMDLIRRIVEFRVEQNTGRPASGEGTTRTRMYCARNWGLVPGWVAHGQVRDSRLIAFPSCEMIGKEPSPSTAHAAGGVAYGSTCVARRATGERRGAV